MVLVLFGCSFMNTNSRNSTTKALTQTEREDLKKPAHLQDLAYGEILFDYYRGNEISALTHILIAQKKNQLSNHANSAELLSGVIYLNLGMLIKAQNIFNRLLTEEDLKDELLAKIEFYLAKLHYKQHDYPQAKRRLIKIFQSLEVGPRDESLIMLSNIALFDKELLKAREWLGEISTDSELLVYVRYNLGILFLRDGLIDESLPLLSKVFLTTKPTDLQRSLQDRAKVALGFYYLRSKQLEKAREQFLAVRLDSLYTNKALLGMGWTYVQKGDYNKALSHWLELRQRDIRDIAVQEVLLAIPYAYQKLKAMKPALQKYLEASTLFQQQIDLISAIETQVTEGHLVEDLVDKMISENQSNNENMDIKDSTLFGDIYDYYIYELLAQNHFNEDFRSYQKLDHLQSLLVHWQKELPMLNEMLRINQYRLDEKNPQIDSYLRQDIYQKYQALYDNIQLDINALNNNEKLYLLADEKQSALHKRILRLEKNIQIIPASMFTDDQINKTSRARGVLQWQLEYGKTKKMWTLRKASAEIRQELASMDGLSQNLSSASDHAMIRFSGYQQLVDDGSVTLIKLRREIKIQVGKQAVLLKEQILSVLKRRKITLDHFLLQSDLSVARLHEKAVLIPEVE